MTTPQPLSSLVGQGGLELEVAYCVGGVIGEPCGVPDPVSVVTPSSSTPTRSQQRSSFSIRRSATRRATWPSSASWSMEPNEAATHYPPRRPPIGGHDHPPLPPVGGPRAGGAGLAAPPGQAAADAGAARWLQVADPRRVDRSPVASGAGAAAAGGAGLDR